MFNSNLQRITEQEYYKSIAKEIELNQIDKGLWTKAKTLAKNLEDIEKQYIQQITSSACCERLNSK